MFFFNVKLYFLPLQDTDSLGEKSRVPEHGSRWELDEEEEFEDLPPPPANIGLATALYDFQVKRISRYKRISNYSPANFNIFPHFFSI